LLISSLLKAVRVTVRARITVRDYLSSPREAVASGDVDSSLARVQTDHA